MKVNLFINPCKSGDPKRQEEYDSCEDSNLKNPNIDAVHYVFPKGEGPERPTFNDFFRRIDWISDEDDVNIVANADIRFDDTASLLRRLVPGYVLALLRWDFVCGSPKILIDRPECQDTWVFRGIPKNIEGDFQIGTPGCDNRIAHEIAKAGYHVVNPARLVKTFHVHETQVRNWIGMPAVPKPYLNVPTTDSIEWMLKE